MVAERHGVVGNVRVNFGEHGPLVDRKEKRTLELITGVQGDDIVVLLLRAAYGRGDTARTARAVFIREAGVALFVKARHARMRVIGMKYGQFETVLLPPRAVFSGATVYHERQNKD